MRSAKMNTPDNLNLIGPGFFEGKKNRGIDNFRTTNSDVMRLCTEIVHH